MLRTVAILEWKKWVGHCGAKEKSKGANINVWWFPVVMKIDLLQINPIKPNIGLWISSEPSPESLQ